MQLANWAAGTRPGVIVTSARTKWEKLLHSLAAGLLKMAVETDNRLEFICDVLLYVLACWREAPARRRRYAEPRRKRVR